MESEKGKKRGKIVTLFDNMLFKIEELVTIIVSIIIICIVLVALVSIIMQAYDLVIRNFDPSSTNSFAVYSEIFGKIMTLLISIEFMNSIAKVLKTHEIKALILDVSLITALSICRRLIIYDFNAHDAITTMATGTLLVAVGIFYFLVRRNGVKHSTAKDNV